MKNAEDTYRPLCTRTVTYYTTASQSEGLSSVTAKTKSRTESYTYATAYVFTSWTCNRNTLVEVSSRETLFTMISSTYGNKATSRPIVITFDEWLNYPNSWWWSSTPSINGINIYGYSQTWKTVEINRSYEITRVVSVGGSATYGRGSIPTNKGFWNCETGKVSKSGSGWDGTAWITQYSFSKGDRYFYMHYTRVTVTTPESIYQYHYTLDYSSGDQSFLTTATTITRTTAYSGISSSTEIV